MHIDTPAFVMIFFPVLFNMVSCLPSTFVLHVMCDVDCLVTVPLSCFKSLMMLVCCCDDLVSVGCEVVLGHLLHGF